MPLSERTVRHYQKVSGYHETGHERTRTDFVLSDGAMPMSSGWRKYHPNEATVEVIDLDGKRRYLTPKQHGVLVAVRTLQDRATLTMIAASLGYATSTVSRALLRLASMGLVAYDVTRGRYGGITMLKTAAVDLKRRAQTAWEALKRQRMSRERAWYDRLSRSGYVFAFNVATSTYMDATLKFDPDSDLPPDASW